MLPAGIKRHRFTAEEYHKMDEVGLTGGKMVEMSPIHWSHAGCVNRLTKMLVRLIGDRYDFESPDGILTPDGPAQAHKCR